MRAVALIVFLALMSGCASVDSTRLRVMTYNIHHGEGTDGKVDLERIAKLITDNKVDLVALQEVDRNTQRTGKCDMPAELAKLTKMKAIFGANFPLEGGEYGNAILSRYPIREWTNYHLPKVVEGEQRGLLRALVETPEASIYFCSTHLDHRRPDADRLASVEVIRKLTAGLIAPTLIAGDFNARPGSEVYRRLASSFNDAWQAIGDGDGFTIPSNQPRARIDYLWFSEGLQPIAGTVLNSVASDHLPLIIDWDAKIGSADNLIVCFPQSAPPLTYFRDAKADFFQ
jgi:endonuclease/exonuclease/phosphatase family metal-dependent hydrolase